jgi:hypothetical protein
MSSIRSSSGVSSTSSLSYCNSDLETTREISEGGHPGYSRGSPSCPPTPRSHPDVLIAVSEPEDKEADATTNRNSSVSLPPPQNKPTAITNSQSVCSSSSSQQERQKLPPGTTSVSGRGQRKLISLRSLDSGDNLPSEDEEFDSLAYQRATGSMKLRRNKPDISSESNNRAESKDDSSLLNHERQRKETTNTNNTNGSKKPKDLLNFLLTDGSLESS